MSTTQPLFPDVGVIALVNDQWTDPWQPRHYVLSELARFFRVVWVDPSPYWREQFRNVPTASEKCPVQPPAGLVVYEPEALLPRLYWPVWLANLSFQLRLKKASQLLVRQGCTKTVLYLWRPRFKDALKLVAHDLSCYHIDDEYSFSTRDPFVEASEANLLSNADHVFIHSPGLMEKKGQVNPNTSFAPNGVNYRAYAASLSEPPDLARIPHPRIGYTGWVKKHLDWSLIIELARCHRDWSFVFVGPQSPHQEVVDPIGSLSEFGNSYFLGLRPNQDLPAYTQHFDVCVMPYQINGYTSCIYPLKLHEYLASGRPIVATPIRTLNDFSDVLFLASSLEEWTKQIEAALHPRSNTPERVADRRAVARGHDWQQLTARIARTILRRLGETRSTDSSYWSLGTEDATGSPEFCNEVSP